MNNESLEIIKDNIMNNDKGSIILFIRQKNSSVKKFLIHSG